MSGRGVRSQARRGEAGYEAWSRDLDAFLESSARSRGLRSRGARAALAVGVAIALTLSFAIVAAPGARAYGAANWQAAFAGTITSPTSGNSGFWGWCDFAGGSGSPASSGNEADCQVSAYFGPSHALQGVDSIHGTAWDEELCTLQPCLTADDFFITAGTMTFSGPAASGLIAIGGPQLTGAGCTIAGNTVTCSLAIWSAIPPGCSPGSCLYNPDTGVPDVAGHYNENGLIPLFVPGGVGELQIQVTQVP